MIGAEPENQIAPRTFKGIAVFTPGGDLVYCRDDQKKSQWHLNLCGALQEHLGLSESPHFLVPSYTATVDCWKEPQSQMTYAIAEAYPLVHHYQGLLNALFGLGNLEWKRMMPSPEYRIASVFDTYRLQFPELWESHDLILDISEQLPVSPPTALPDKSGNTSVRAVLRLFVSGHSALTEQILTTLQSVLETSRYYPYTLQMVDVSKHPEQAEADQISATPTLIRVSPKPVRRLVGDLDNPRAILSLLSEP